MQVYKKTQYVCDDKTFNNLEDVRGHVESKIGLLIDKHCHFRDRQEVFKLLLTNRKELVELLTVCIDTPDYGYVNIFNTEVLS